MPQFDDNLAYDAANLNTTLSSITKRPQRYLITGLSLWAKDIVFFATIFIMMAKSVLFIGLANNENTAQFSMLKAFHSFSSPPPLTIYAFFSVIFLSFSFIFRGRAHYWFLVLINFLFSFLLVADLMYFRGFNSFLSPYLLSQSSNLDNLFSSIVSMLRPIDLLFIPDLVIFVLLGLRFKTLYVRAQRNPVTVLFLLALSISYISYQHYAMDIKGNGDSMLFRVAWVPNQTMTNLSPLGYHMYDIYNFYEDNKTVKLTPQEKQDISSWYAQKQENLPPNAYSGMFKGKNLIVIQVESLENFVINQKVNGQEITPNINRLLTNSFYFPNYYEQVYNGTSSDADLMTNTSVYPVRSGATFFRFPYNTYNSLPKMLQGIGYNTTAIHPDKGSFWNWMPALTSIGFQRTIDASHFTQDEKIGLGLSDGSYLKQIVPIIEKEKQPFYNFMVTLTSHSPFDLPDQYRMLHLNDTLDKTKLGGYFQSVRYTDEQIGNFLGTLDKKGLLDNTVVVIYGDHTGVHKYYNDEVKQVKPQENWWLDDSKRIPLIIFQKGMKGQMVATTGGQIDLLPTVASLMGIDEIQYKDTAMGRNLLNTKKDFAVLANRQVVGKDVDSNDQANAITGIDIADLLLRSNYFKNK